jgi:hypothetical protein
MQTPSPRRRRADKRSWLAEDLELSLTTEEEEEEGPHRRRQKLPVTPGRSMPSTEAFSPDALMPPPPPPQQSPCYTYSERSSSSSSSSGVSSGFSAYSYDDAVAGCSRPSTSSSSSSGYSSPAAATRDLVQTPVSFRIEPLLPLVLPQVLPLVNDTFIESHVVQVSPRRRPQSPVQHNSRCLFFP